MCESLAIPLWLNQNLLLLLCQSLWMISFSDIIFAGLDRDLRDSLHYRRGRHYSRGDFRRNVLCTMFGYRSACEEGEKWSAGTGCGEGIRGLCDGIWKEMANASWLLEPSTGASRSSRVKSRHIFNPASLCWVSIRASPAGAHDASLGNTKYDCPWLNMRIYDCLGFPWLREKLNLWGGREWQSQRLMYKR